MQFPPSTQKISPYAYPGMPEIIPHTATPENIIYLVCKEFRVSSAMLMGKNRSAKYVRARHVAWHLMKEYSRDVTLMEMGRMFKKDHTTVIHGLRSIADHLETDYDLRLQVDKLAKVVKMRA